jgi:hypothetical protein
LLAQGRNMAIDCQSSAHILQWAMSVRQSAKPAA